MRNVLRASLLLLLVPLTATAQGQTARRPDAKSGHELLQVCGTDNRDSDFWFCQGYLTGLHQTTITFATLGLIKPAYCPPAGFTNRALRNVVVSYLRAYPDELHKSAEVLTLTALSTAYPCPKQ